MQINHSTPSPAWNSMRLKFPYLSFHSLKSASETSLLPSQGQNSSLPAVSHPQRGHLFRWWERFRKGIMGRKKNSRNTGMPVIKKRSVITSERKRRSPLSSHLSMTTTPQTEAAGFLPAFPIMPPLLQHMQEVHQTTRHAARH